MLNQVKFLKVKSIFWVAETSIGWGNHRKKNQFFKSHFVGSMAGQSPEPSLWLNWLRAPGEVTASMEIGDIWSISCWIFVKWKGKSTGSPLLSMWKTHVFSMDFPWFSLESIEKRKYIANDSNIIWALWMTLDDWSCWSWVIGCKSSVFGETHISEIYQ